eukprot:gnl/TRDRNA2_/TRDRNA2_42808_c0_seq1.p1 gnl/TRDRNA2_/TRDRNA2_42808_c0~~gnl/TRDRNA2_/TRDRNA2_42808_c0_seq1.p1  ORF type:complete len:522 (-),score=93.44 gnl/TRDRNA2_/TRDRNA2_42808_c0_seq1:65-1576(-)
MGAEPEARAPGGVTGLGEAAPMATAEVMVSPPVRVMPKMIPAPRLAAAPLQAPPSTARSCLVLGDENFRFTAGLQEAYPDIEFTSATMLSPGNLELKKFDPNPRILCGRVRHTVDPCKAAKHFGSGSFDEIMLFLPGLCFQVPKELGHADRQLFAFRTHFFVFQVICHVKILLKNEGKLHLVWPSASGLLCSPCGAAGIEMMQLVRFCGCSEKEPSFDMRKINQVYVQPFLFGDVPQELPAWLESMQIHSYTLTKDPIPVPLPVALLMHPDMRFVNIKDPMTDGDAVPPGANAGLRGGLHHEATQRKTRLRAVYAPREGEDPANCVGLVPDVREKEEALLQVPMEMFLMSFEEMAHICLMLRYQVLDEQPQMSITCLELLDPRMPTRIARPTLPKSSYDQLVQAMNELTGGGNGDASKRQADGRSSEYCGEEWGGMKFHCQLTKICTLTAEKMRLHMQGDLYKRLAAATPGWDEGQDKKSLILKLEEAEAEEGQQQKKARTQR